LIFAVVLSFLAMTSTPSYRNCDKERYARAQQENQTLEGVGRVIFGLKTFAKCGAISTNENNGVITALATFVIACFTFTLWLTNRGQLIHTRQTERAYFAGGGECYRDISGMPALNKDGHRLFRFEVGNHGKTPAFMDEYAIQFATLDEVCRRRIPFEPRTFVDQFPPGERSRPTGPPISITRTDADVAFGAVWYKDIWGRSHYSRFILRIAANGQTHSNVPGIYSAYYRDWT
jgi:hypothetical protein